MELILLKLHVQADTSVHKELNLQPNSHVQQAPTVMMEPGAVIVLVELPTVVRLALMTSTAHWVPRLLMLAHQGNYADQLMHLSEEHPMRTTALMLVNTAMDPHARHVQPIATAQEVILIH
jgi:hypothetical protein